MQRQKACNRGTSIKDARTRQCIDEAPLYVTSLGREERSANFVHNQQGSGRHPSWTFGGRQAQTATLLRRNDSPNGCGRRGLFFRKHKIGWASNTRTALTRSTLVTAAQGTAWPRSGFSTLMPFSSATIRGHQAHPYMTPVTAITRTAVTTEE